MLYSVLALGKREEGKVGYNWFSEFINVVIKDLIPKT
jgi:hypothetical protein